MSHEVYHWETSFPTSPHLIVWFLCTWIVGSESLDLTPWDNNLTSWSVIQWGRAVPLAFRLPDSTSLQSSVGQHLLHEVLSSARLLHAFALLCHILTSVLGHPDLPKGLTLVYIKVHFCVVKSYGFLPRAQCRVCPVMVSHQTVSPPCKVPHRVFLLNARQPPSFVLFLSLVSLFPECCVIRIVQHAAFSDFAHSGRHFRVIHVFCG